MPDTIFILRIAHYRSSQIEEREHTTSEAAWEAFRLFATPDSFEIYSRVELVEYFPQEQQEYPLAQLTFLA